MSEHVDIKEHTRRNCFFPRGYVISKDGIHTPCVRTHMGIFQVGEPHTDRDAAGAIARTSAHVLEARMSYMVEEHVKPLTKVDDI